MTLEARGYIIQNFVVIYGLGLHLNIYFWVITTKFSQ